MRRIFGSVTYSPLPIAYCLLAGTDPREVVGGQRVREAVIGGSEGLVVVAELVAPQAVEELVDMGLPVIDRLILADRLGQRVEVLQHGSPGTRGTGTTRAPGSSRLSCESCARALYSKCLRRAATAEIALSRRCPIFPSPQVA